MKKEIETNLTKTFTVTYKQDGKEITEIYDYDFLKMPINRIFRAEQLFILDVEFYRKEHIPASDQQFIEYMKRNTFLKAMSCILMRRTENGYEPLTDEMPISFFSHLTGKDYNDLLECRNDFFLRSKALLELSQQLSLEQLAKVGKEMPEESFRLLMNILKTQTASV